MTKPNLDFPTTKKYTKEDIKKVQNRLLEMANVILPLLEKNNIPYIISYGTLLGAIRHHGFIPWDDDFDIFLFGEQYDRALEILRKSLPEDMIVHDKQNDPIYWPYWSRVRDLNSEVYSQLYPRDNYYKYRGINFDLYRLDLVKRKDAEKLRYENYLSYQERIYKSGLITKTERDVAKAEIYPKYLAAKQAAEKSNDDKNVYWFIMGYYDGVDEDIIFPLKKYDFEGFQYYGPNDGGKMIGQRYPDYMQIPEYNERKPHYTWVKFNTTKEKNHE